MGLNHREIINIMQNAANFGVSSLKIDETGIFMEFSTNLKESFTIPGIPDKISKSIVEKQKKVEQEQKWIDQEEEKEEAANNLIIDNPEEYEAALANDKLVEDTDYDGI